MRSRFTFLCSHSKPAYHCLLYEWSVARVLSYNTIGQTDAIHSVSKKHVQRLVSPPVHVSCSHCYSCNGEEVKAPVQFDVIHVVSLVGIITVTCSSIVQKTFQLWTLLLKKRRIGLNLF